MTLDNKTAVVLLSGGLDSATVLAIAKKQGYRLYAISFRYGHAIKKNSYERKKLQMRTKLKSIW